MILLSAVILLLWLRSFATALPQVGSTARFGNATTPTLTHVAVTSPAITKAPVLATTTCTIYFNKYLVNLDHLDPNGLYNGWTPEQSSACRGQPTTFSLVQNVWEYVTWDPIMASSCSSEYASEIDDFRSTAAHTVLNVTKWSDGIPTDSLFTEYNEAWKGFHPTTGSPCCLNCTVAGGQVEVYYWPGPTDAQVFTAPPPLMTGVVNEAGFTFTSPETYVVFHSMSANDYCGAVGSAIESTTISFQPGELQTAKAWDVVNSADVDFNWPRLPNDFKIADWNELVSCGPQTSIFYQDLVDFEIWTTSRPLPSSCITSSDDCYIYHFTITWDDCKPAISALPDLFSDSGPWANCQKGQITFIDPPYALTPGNKFTLITFAPTDPAQPPYVLYPDSTVTNGLGMLTLSAPGVSPKPPPPTPMPAHTGPQPGNTVVPPGATATAPPIPDSTSISQPAQSDPPPNDLPPQSGNASPNNSPTPGNGNRPTQTPQLPNGKPAPTAGFVIGTQTVLPGGPAITVSGTTYSLPPQPPAPTSKALPESGVDSGFGSGSGSGSGAGSGTDAASLPSIIIINGSTRSFIHPGSSSYILGSTWLVAGSSAITVDGTRISLMTGGSSVVVGSVTEDIGGFLAPVETGIATVSGSGVGGSGGGGSGNGAPILSLGEFATPTTVIGAATGTGTSGTNIDTSTTNVAGAATSTGASGTKIDGKVSGAISSYDPSWAPWALMSFLWGALALLVIV